MKKIIFCITLILFVVKSFSQTDSTRLSKDYFLQKSKIQKTVARILLGSGIGIAAAGGIIQLVHENQRNGGVDLDFTGTKIAMGGGVVCLSSIPFFFEFVNK